VCQDGPRLLFALCRDVFFSFARPSTSHFLWQKINTTDIGHPAKTRIDIGKRQRHHRPARLGQFAPFLAEARTANTTFCRRRAAPAKKRRHDPPPPNATRPMPAPFFRKERKKSGINRLCFDSSFFHRASFPSFVFDSATPFVLAPPPLPIPAATISSKPWPPPKNA